MTFDGSEESTIAQQIAFRDLSTLWIYPNVGILIATIVIVLGIWLWNDVQKGFQKWSKHVKIACELPGPRALPLIGNALQFACKHDELLNRLVDLCASYDTPFRFWMGPKLLIVVTEPRDVEVILNSSKATHKSSLYRFMRPFVGDGLVSGSGPIHKSHRKAIMPMLNSKVLDTYVEYFDNQSRRCVERMQDHVDAGDFDIYPFMEICTMDMILDTIMGTPGIAQQEGYKQLLECTRRMYTLIHDRMMKFWLHPDWIHVHTKAHDEILNAQHVIHGFTESLLTRKKKEHYALKRGSVLSKRPRCMLVEQLIDHVERTKLMDDHQLRDEIFTIFTAAQDTSASIGSFIFLMLGMHLDVQDKVREELFQVLGNDSVTSESLCKLKYLESVIKETIRLFPIAPLLVRELTGDVKLESCTLPENCSVVIVAHCTHRLAKHWSDPEKFNPDRFTPENSKDRHDYAYIPFSGGARGCIGQKYAIMSLKTIVANVVRKYRIKSSSSLDKLRLKTDISIRSVDGYKISVTMYDK